VPKQGAGQISGNTFLRRIATTISLPRRYPIGSTIRGPSEKSLPPHMACGSVGNLFADLVTWF